MAKQQNTYAKRQREMEKKLKADEKRQRRKKRVEQKAQASQLDPAEAAAPEIEEPSARADSTASTMLRDRRRAEHP